MAATAAVALVALLPGSWGSALAQTAGTPTPIPEPTVTRIEIAPGEASGFGLGRGVWMSVPARAFPQPVEVEHVPVFQLVGQSGLTPQQALDAVRRAAKALGIGDVPRVAALDDSFYLELGQRTALVWDLFVLEARLSDGTPVDPRQLVRLEFDITPEMLAETFGDLTRARLAFWNGGTSQWQDASCSVDRPTLRLMCSLSHFSLWLLYLDVSPDTPALVPYPANTGTNATESVRLPSLGAGIAGLALLVGSLGLGRTLFRRRSAARSDAGATH